MATASAVSKLLSSVKLGDFALKNRVVMAPLTRGRSGVKGIQTDAGVEYYSARASAGLIISEATHISPQGKGWSGAPGIFSGEQVAAWKKITDAVHAKNSIMVLQLWHMGRASHSSFHGGALPVAPSAIAINDSIHIGSGEKVPYEVPRALEESEIPGIVEEYRKGALNAVAAGFDGVEIHGANGYLLDQFLQSTTNTRTDSYGGSIEKRARILFEVVEAVVSVVPSSRVGIRLSPNGVFNNMVSRGEKLEVWMGKGGGIKW